MLTARTDELKRVFSLSTTSNLSHFAERQVQLCPAPIINASASGNAAPVTRKTTRSHNGPFSSPSQSVWASVALKHSM